MLLAASWWYNNLAPHVHAYGHNTFWWGFLHGLLIVPNFLYSLINSHVTIYQSPNTGIGYNFGFMLGISAFSGGAGASRHRK